MSQIQAGKAAFLGAVQGLTEFLPVSSSGHLVAFQHLLGLRAPELVFDVVVHGGTLLAVLIVYGRDLWQIVRESLLALPEMVRHRSVSVVWGRRPYLRLAVWLLLGSVPAALVGIPFQHEVERAFGSLLSVGCMLLVTGTLLYAAKFADGPGRGLQALRPRDCLVIGIAQSVALLPGISRSGSTIVAGLFCGLNRDRAARFSFLLSVPAILGANVLEILKARGTVEATVCWPLLVGGLTALITGYFALRLLLKIVHKGRLFRFAWYCWAVGICIILIAWIRPGF